MIELDAQLQDQINATASRYYWQARLHNGHRVPTRELLNIAQQAIQNFHDATLSAGLDKLPETEMGKFVRAAEAWLTRERGKLWKLAEQEGDEKC